MDERNINVKTVYSTKWLKVHEIEYEDPNKQIRKWDAVERTTKKGEIDAVDIFAILKKDGEEDKIILTLQYRPPLNAYVLEFPAGLVDPDEDPKESAIRELYEETGYTSEYIKHTPGLVVESGLLNELIQVVQVEIDGNKPENVNPEPHLEDGEFIETVILPMKNLYDHIQEFCERRKCLCDAKLYTFAMGMKFGSV